MRDADRVSVPRVASMETTAFSATALVVTPNDTVEAPAGIVTVLGTVAALGSLLVKVTVVSDEGA